jgi:hypothetical protein
MMNWQK